jgi:hypothetical protein
MNPSLCDLVRSALLEGGLVDSALRPTTNPTTSPTTSPTASAMASPTPSATEAPQPPSAQMREHLASCAACRHASRAWPLAARALTELRREPAPRELDSAVVAALHAGARTERAIQALQRLARLSPPPQLTTALDANAESDEHDAEDLPPAEVERLRAVGRAPAPRVLDRLVQEELLDPAKSRVRRHVGGLHRLAAPEALRERVADNFTRERRERAPRAALRKHTARHLRLVLGAAAAFVLLALPFLSRPEDPQEKSRPFRVERASSVGALSPITRDLLNAASSGMSARERS